jgi:hypothetical protein
MQKPIKNTLNHDILYLLIRKMKFMIDLNKHEKRLNQLGTSCPSSPFLHNCQGSWAVYFTMLSMYTLYPFLSNYLTSNLNVLKSL